MSAGKTFAKLLEINFQGYFLCRIATDPDPTNERLGVSGYTMALVNEDPLDQVIRTQITEEFACKNLREPADRMGIRIGVDVTDVLFDGARYEPGYKALCGAKVFLQGQNDPFPGPTFDSRNNIVGSDDTMSFVVNPFDLEIRGAEVTIRGVDHLNPAQPTQPIWEIEDPSTYVRRLPVNFAQGSTPVMSILRVFDQYTYFADRRRYLKERIDQLEEELRQGQGDAAELLARIQGLKSRIYQIEFWGDRVINKMGFQLSYAFRLNGKQEVSDPQGLLKGRPDLAHPWSTSFWFGGWDGDLLTGYMQGTLALPFEPEKH
jgi:hypothetical protein